ncbi:MAG: YihY family inner membrane protein [Deltaproteobacteria bacterium]|nr:YihY family inner membrane protein [Deltaproteobacteria bacterium]
MEAYLLRLYRSLTSGEDVHPLLVPVRAPLRWVLLFYRQLSRNRAFIQAAGMAYTTLIALVPGLLLVFGVLGSMGLLNSHLHEVEDLVFGTFLADIPEVRDILWPGLKSVDLATLGLVGTLGLVTVVARLYMMVEAAYSDIFGVPVDRPLTTRMLNFYFTLTAVPIATVGSVVLASTVTSDLGLGWSSTLLSYVLSYGVIFAALKLFPNTHVRWRSALLGATVTWVLLQAGGSLFPLYVRFVASDDPLAVIYGSLGLIPIFLLWLYLLWIFVLLGVQVAYVAQNYDSLLEAELEVIRQRKAPVKGPTLPLAIEVLVHVGWAFERGSGPVGADELARHLTVPQREVRAMLRVLAGLGAVVETEVGWMLGKPPESIGLGALAAGWERSTSLGAKVEGSVTAQVSAQIEASFEGTLEDALERWREAADSVAQSTSETERG